MIEVMTKEQWEEIHNSEWRAEARKRQNYWNKKHAADKAERRYYIKQRLSGLFLIKIGRTCNMLELTFGDHKSTINYILTDRVTFGNMDHVY